MTVILCHSSSFCRSFSKVIFQFLSFPIVDSFPSIFSFSFRCHGGQHSAELKSLVSRYFLRSRKYWVCYLLAITGQRRQWHPIQVLLPGKSHGRRSLVGCSPWGRKESDTTEWLHFHFSLSCMGEGNGNPLQCSCLENPRDGEAWWAAVYGVAQS